MTIRFTKSACYKLDLAVMNTSSIKVNGQLNSDCPARHNIVHCVLVHGCMTHALYYDHHTCLRGLIIITNVNHSL